MFPTIEFQRKGCDDWLVIEMHIFTYDWEIDTYLIFALNVYAFSQMQVKKSAVSFKPENFITFCIR